MEPPTTSKSLYEAASHRHELAGAGLAWARKQARDARIVLEAAEDEWVASAAELRQHESKPGIPLYLSTAPHPPADDRAAGHE